VASIRVRAKGGREMQALQRRLREAANGKELRRELTLELRLAAAPAVNDVQRSVRSVEVSSSAGGGKSSGLRGRIAAATSVRPIPMGARIFVSGKKVDARYGRTLARLMNDTGGRPWVHPLFGNPRSQHTQKGRDYFASAIWPHQDKFRQAVLDAMKTVADKIRG
jgi:hypothetical protein